MKNIFNAQVVSEIVSRINKLNASTQPQWGKMSVGQMLAHCNITYEMVYDNIHQKPNAFVKLMLKLFVKSKVVGESSYQKNGQTAPQFIIKEDKNFNIEKERLIAYLQKTQGLGEGYFEGRESHSFGKLTVTEWNNMFYKHIDHHLRQFGV